MKSRSHLQPPRLAAVALFVFGGAAALSCGDPVAPTAPVASVSVAIVSPSLVVRTTTLATATTRDADGSILDGRPVTWSSGNTEVATVSPTGEVTALKAGTAEIKATSEGKDGSAMLTVVPPPVAAVSVALGASTVLAGNTTTAVATLSDANGNALTGRAITWTSSDIAIATVSDQGVVTAVKAGNASIIATSEGKSGSAPLTVTPPAIHTITVVIANPALSVGQTTQASAVAKDASGNTLTGRPIVWTTENSEVATVNEQGVVTAVKVGSARITASSEGKSGSASLAVGAAPIHSITVVVANPNPHVGQTTQASAIAKDANGNELTGRPIVWSTDAAEVATVNAQGVVTGINAGTAVITATSEGKSGSASVSVSLVPVHSVTVSVADAQITAGGSTHATAVARDVNGNAIWGLLIEWSTDNNQVAVVGTQGAVFGLKAGTASVIATIGGKSGSAPLTVLSPQISFDQQPTSVVAYNFILPAVKVSVRDVSGRAINTRVTMSLGANPGNATLGGTLTQNVVDGVATFSDLTVSSAGSGYTLVATIPDGGGTSATSASFDVAARTGAGWLTKSPMPTARSHFGVAVVDGIIYVFGGTNRSIEGALSMTILAYNASTDTWKTVGTSLRRGDAVAAMGALVYSTNGTHLDVYNTATNTWASRAPLPTAVKLPTAAVVNGILYVAGAIGANADQPVMLAYDPATDSWTARRPPLTVVSALAVADPNGVGNSQIYGGTDAGEFFGYDPVTDRWTYLSRIRVPRRGFGLVGWRDRVFIVGGALGPDPSSPHDQRRVANVEVYDPGVDFWRAVVPMNTAREALGVATLPGTRVRLFAIGGEAGRFLGEAPTDVNEELEP